MEQSLSDRIRRLLDRLTGREQKLAQSREEERSLQLLYDRFREVLALNDSIHQLIVDLEEKLEGRVPFSFEAMAVRVKKSLLDAMIMVKDLNQISGDRFPELYDAIARLNAEVEKRIGRTVTRAEGPLTVPLSELRASDALLAGVKMANLGEVRGLGFNVPEGFAVTTAAFDLFMEENGLRERTHTLKRIIATRGPEGIVAPSREVRESILNAPAPERLVEAIQASYDRIAAGAVLPVALRSSAVGEDLASSHAGQYYSELDVRRPGLIHAYRFVLASLYKPYALAYDWERGQTEAETSMAVGCLAMVRPRVAGVLFSRDFRNPEADRLEISLTRGLAAGLVGGETDADHVVVGPGDLDRDCCGLSAAELRLLFETGRQLEAHFGKPQDVEWAIDGEGKLWILQAREMVQARISSRVRAEDAEGASVLLEGGRMASPGAGSGPVFHLTDEASLDAFPEGAVAVARFASPSFSRILTRAAAVVTEVGSPTSHLGILTREFGVPAIMGMKGAAGALPPGTVVTVDASGQRVYAGAVPIERTAERDERPLLGSPALTALAELSRLVIPLRLTDPAASEFTPAGIQSLHDLSRYIHENLYETMFRLGEGASKRLHTAVELEADLPLAVRVFDLGGGLRAGEGDKVRPEDVVGPFRSFLAGMLDERIDRNKPRSVSAAGFMSVMGQSMMGPPPDSSGMGDVSFAVVSEHYLNFSIKAGYHFSTIDAFAGSSSGSYINFRFAGGGAGGERRERRIRFLTAVLGELNFEVTVKGDLLNARVERLEPNEMEQRLESLGRLTVCSRQLDMLMDNDESPGFFARAFSEEKFEAF